jgi:hypothetical protein
MANIALGPNYALIVFAVTILFDHIGYTSMLPVFGELAAAPRQPEPQPALAHVREFRPAVATRFLASPPTLSTWQLATKPTLRPAKVWSKPAGALQSEL